MTDRLPIDKFSARKCGFKFRPIIVVEDLQGRQWIMKQSFRVDDPRIPATIKKLDEVCSIDPRLWEINTGRRY